LGVIFDFFSSIFADVSGGQDMTGYYPRETDRAGYHSLRDNDAIGASYDRYLRNGVQTQFFILYFFVLFCCLLEYRVIDLPFICVINS
jgi:hypothetical protein